MDARFRSFVIEMDTNLLFQNEKEHDSYVPLWKKYKENIVLLFYHRRRHSKSRYFCSMIERDIILQF